MDGGDKRSSSSNDNDRKENIEGLDDMPNWSLEKLVSYTVEKLMDAAAHIDPKQDESYAKLATMMQVERRSRRRSSTLLQEERKQSV